MKPGKSFSFKYLIINMICVISQFILPFAVSMAQTYTFKRMWPVFEQPWYFLRPSGIAVDNKGFIYVADTENDRIQKFTSDGQFISNWGKHGQGKGEFNFPTGIAVDINNNLYVADSENHRIQKFNSEGIFVISWGNEGNNGDEQLYKPQAVAADQFGSIYVADTGNSRIQKFTSDGEILKWDVQDIETFQFGNPKGIYVDKHGFIYVTDVELHQVLKFSQDGKKMDWEPDKKINSPHSLVMDEIGFIYITDMENSRILKFNSKGTFIKEWGTQGSRDNEFASPQGLAADKNAYIYVADTDNHRIQKFSQDGIFMNRWGTGSEDGEFNHPDGMALDKEGNIYIADTGSHCIQKFSSTGEFLIKWGTQGSADGEFNSPVSVAVYALDDDTEIVFVSDMLNSRIARFSSHGQFLGELGKGDLDLPRGIAADNLGNLFVADMGNNRIVKFSLDGILLEQWGNEGDADGEFSYPRGIAFVSDKTGSDYVYVADTLNHRIQKFSSTGQFIAKWGEEGLSEAMFSFPSALAVNSDGDVYVADMKNSRVQIFSSTGEFKGLCGELGSSPGQLNFPRGLAIAPDKTLYVADSENHRIQVFENTGSQVRNKAIIVAGGGPYPGNNLWDSTRMCSNFAYRTLNYQGFTKDDIYYLTEDTKLDLDNNGIADDVDGIPLIISFQNAITQWGKDAENLVIYITDHGGDKTFRLGRNQTLSASELDTWLDQVQEESSTKIIVIYDACESGSFISSLIPPVGKERIVITSTSFEESAYFVTQGTVSFSNYFWTRIFNGNNVFKAFKAAREAVSLTMVYQHPLLDYTGDGIPDNADLVLSENTFIGNGTELSGEKPVIGKVSPEQNINGINSAILFAEDVADFDSIARVWAEIRVPGYKPGNPDNTVQALPFVDLMPKGNGFYEAEYDNFNIQGIYDIAVYARDRKGNISDPGFTRVRVNDPLRHKAVIIAGGPKNHSLRPAIEMNAGLAYDALKFQGYSDNDIFLMSPVSISSVKNIMPGLENLDSLLPSWIGDDTKTLLVYLVGIGEEKSFKINQNEKLTASHLNVLLNTMQDNISGQVTVIYDASLSGSFLPELVSAEETKRIVISSASNVQAASFASGGDISFSQYFWNRIINGSDIYTAFVYAKNAVWFATESQNSLLDDNGNGIGNEKYDGLLARKIIPGTGIILTGNQPLVNNISADQILYEKVAASIRIENITTTSEVETAWAVIKPPVNMEFPGEPYADLPVIELNRV